MTEWHHPSAISKLEIDFDRLEALQQELLVDFKHHQFRYTHSAAVKRAI